MLNARPDKQLNAKLRLSVLLKLKLLAKQPKQKLHAKLKLHAYLLKLALMLKLKPEQPLMLPPLPRPKGFSFSSLVWTLSL